MTTESKTNAKTTETSDATKGVLFKGSQDGLMFLSVHVYVTVNMTSQHSDSFHIFRLNGERIHVLH